MLMTCTKHVKCTYFSRNTGVVFVTDFFEPVTSSCMLQKFLRLVEATQGVCWSKTERTDDTDIQVRTVWDSALRSETLRT
jgi:hypothetical protein